MTHLITGDRDPLERVFGEEVLEGELQQPQDPVVRVRSLVSVQRAVALTTRTLRVEYARCRHCRIQQRAQLGSLIPRSRNGLREYCVCSVELEPCPQHTNTQVDLKRRAALKPPRP